MTAPVSACANGGISVDAGIDTNGSGVLDASEVTSTQYVCNGAAGTNGTNGTNGLAALVSVTTEPASTNCASGGKKVSVGLDSNGNGMLGNSEITSSDYICNGANAADGLNGTNGLNTLMSIVTVPSGTSCATGGQKITSGLDTNTNETLDAPEVTTTTYVCNGAIGPAGPGVTWVHVTGTSVQAVPNTGYLADNDSQVTITLPASPSFGDVVQVSGVGIGGWKIAQNPDQTIVTKDLPRGPIGATWIPRDSDRNWQSVASSSDGAKLVAVVYGGQIYTSTDSGATWTARDSNRSWQSVASSSDGTKLVAVVFDGQIYTSTDSGVTWTVRDAVRLWSSVASSGDGALLAAVELNGQIYISADSGATWTPRDSARYWASVASSSDGTTLVALQGSGGQIYTSNYSRASMLSTTAGIAGFIGGAQYNAVELQYIGSNTFTVLSSEGYLVVQ
jgi:hypothetical protein